jgi:hypothetical protein
MPKPDFTARIVKRSAAPKMATSLRETNAKPEVRYRALGGNSDEWRNWWDLPTEKIGGALAQLVDRIDTNNYEERNRFLRYARLYGNYESLGWASMSAMNRQDQSNNRPVYNVIQSSVDTVNSKVARDNPAPYFITSGADYFDKLKAEKQTQFVIGVFQETKLYDVANNDVFRDGAVYGLGGIEWLLNPQTNRIEADWVFIDELKIDRYDGAKGAPRSIHRVVMLQKEMLLARYKGDDEAIEKILRTTQTRPLVFRGQESVVDFCVIRKSWHLAIGKSGDRGYVPGRYVETIDDEVLTDEEYKFDEFPFAFFRWYKKAAGFMGRGIAEELTSGQVEINKILMFIQQCQELQASPLILVDNASGVSEDVILSNNIARMVKGRFANGGFAPQFLSPASTGPEIYQHLQWWITNSYGKVGISATSAQGTKQPGVNSAIAMRTMVDVESSRFIQVSKNWEKFFVDCAEIVVRLAKQAYEKDKDWSVDYTDKRGKFIKSIPWAKINAANDTFTIKCDTVSGFPATAAGRIQTVTDFISNHYISFERGMELLNIDPDLQDEIELATSSLRLCEKSLAEMVEDGVYTHPEKYLNLKLALSVSEATYNQLCIDGCPEDRLQLVRQWIDELCTKLGAPDPQLVMLQNVFNPPAQAAVAPQAGLQPAA